jgi:hypothetical protein
VWGDYHRGASSGAGSVPPTETDAMTSEAGGFTEGGISDEEDEEEGDEDESTTVKHSNLNTKVIVGKAAKVVSRGSFITSVRLH